MAFDQKLHAKKSLTFGEGETGALNLHTHKKPVVSEKSCWDKKSENVLTCIS